LYYSIFLLLFQIYYVYCHGWSALTGNCPHWQPAIAVIIVQLFDLFSLLINSVALSLYPLVITVVETTDAASKLQWIQLKSGVNRSPVVPWDSTCAWQQTMTWHLHTRTHHSPPTVKCRASFAT